MKFTIDMTVCVCWFFFSFSLSRCDSRTQNIYTYKKKWVSWRQVVAQWVSISWHAVQFFVYHIESIQSNANQINYICIYAIWNSLYWRALEISSIRAIRKSKAIDRVLRPKLNHSSVLCEYEWNEEEMIGLVMEQQPIKRVWFCLSG